MTSSTLPAQFIYGRIADGNAYIVTKIVTIPAGGSANVHLRNSHDDNVMWISDMEMFGSGDLEFYVHDQFNSITTGDDVIIQNALMDSDNGGPDEGPFEAFVDSTYDSVYEYPVGFTYTDKKSTSGVNISAEAIEPGREAVFEFRNLTQSQQKGFFGVLLLSSY